MCFFHMAATGLLVPYLAPYLESRGLVGGTQGALFALRTGLATAAAPLFGLAADRYGVGRVLRFAATLAALAAVLLLVARSPLHFVPVFLLMALGSSSVSPLTDAAILGLLERQPKGSPIGGIESYGRSRLFGSAGFAVSALGFGLLFPYMLPAESSRLAIVGVALLSSVGFLLAFDVRGTAGMLRRPDWRDVPRLLRYEGVRPLLLCGALQWASLAPYHFFFGAHVQHHGGGPRTIGLSVAVAVACEMAVMAAAPRWLTRIAPRHVLAFSALTGTLRWWVTAIGSPEWIIAAQALHGFGYGAFYIALVDAIVKRTPSELRGTSQALVAACAVGMGTLLGNLVAGPVYAVDQGRMLFLGTAGFSVVPALIALMVRPAAGRSRVSAGVGGDVD